MSTISIALLPTSSIIQWVRSGKAPPEWRIYHSNGTIRYTWGNLIMLSLLVYYPFVVIVAFCGFAILLSEQLTYPPNVFGLVLISLVTLTIFVLGVFFIMGLRLLLNRVQQRWRMKTRAERLSPLVQGLQEFPLWISSTYIVGIVSNMWLITHHVFPSDWILSGIVAILVFPWMYIFAAFLATKIVLPGEPLLIMTGAGFVEVTTFLKRYDYPLVASIEIVEYGRALLITSTAGVKSLWGPANKYDITFGDIIRDYERYKAENTASK